MKAVNLLELEDLARERLPQGPFDFIAGGAEDEVTLRANREAFQRIQLRPRVLVDVSTVDPSTEVLGRRVELPVLLAPVALQRLAHDEGELASARAAEAAGTVMVLSTVSTCTLEDVAAAAGGHKWFQLYPLRNKEGTERLISRAKAAGYTAICVTADVPWLGRREADIRNNLQFGADIVPANLLDEIRLADLASGPRGPAGGAAAGLSDPGLDWDGIDWIRSVSSPLPVLVKGILTAEDARLAVEHGVEGVIVSNHGGRQLDGAPASIEALPEVVAAVEGRAEVLLDSGIRRGTDVLKALALGARAVLIGRPYIWGLAIDGEAGVSSVLSMLREEIELAMALSGCPTVADIDRSRVRLGSPAE
ncbi:MAG: alpha-hydroxy acid oxidase [Dehalococcoidia bacterium]